MTAPRARKTRRARVQVLAAQGEKVAFLVGKDRGVKSIYACHVSLDEVL